ncbi:MAG: helix-turn-helix domain-containing protein [Clostridia bacterium]
MLNERIIVQSLKSHNNLTYTVQEISKILSISTRSAYNLCGSKPDFKVIKVGRTLRVHRESFDRWFNDCGEMAAE